MVLYNGEVFVAQKGTNQILIIDVNTNVVTDSITVGREPNSLVLDAFNNLWVLCSGGINEALPELIQINTSNHTVMKSLIFSGLSESPNSLKIDSSGTKLFYLNNSLYKQPISSTALNSAPFISSGNSIYYGLGVNPFNNEIYLADAIDYVQPGKVYRYDNSANLIDSLSVGIIPQDFTFLEN
jgi:YVTN family beta-propeller protein